MSEHQRTVAERFDRDPLGNPPPCVRNPAVACDEACEFGLGNTGCVRERRDAALSRLAALDGETL